MKPVIVLCLAFLCLSMVLSAPAPAPAPILATAIGVNAAGVATLAFPNLIQVATLGGLVLLPELLNQD